MSKLTKVFVYPKPKERQTVVTCLRIFCEKTCTIIINRPSKRKLDVREHTTTFIKIGVR